MRMRKKKHADERIQICIDSGYMRWNDMLEKDKPVCLEIGCGKGDFICGMALKFHDINFIAVEKNSDVMVIAMEKAKSLNLPNVKFIIIDAKELEHHLDPETINNIYLNFSDPWHKRYQHNNRLTSPAFLDTYKKFLKPNAKIILKTDNKDFFDFSIKTLPLNGFKIITKTYDLYNSEFFDLNENVQTEYEKKFVEQNIPICYFEAIFASIL